MQLPSKAKAVHYEEEYGRRYIMRVRVKATCNDSIIGRKGDPNFTSDPCRVTCKRCKRYTG